MSTFDTLTITRHSEDVFHITCSIGNLTIELEESRHLLSEHIESIFTTTAAALLERLNDRLE